MDNRKRDLRNILLHIMEGGFFMAAMVFLDQYTIMIGFMRRLTENPLVISLVPAAIAVGFNVPGLFTAQYIQRIQNKHLFIVITGFFQRLMVLSMALFTLSLGHFSPITSGLISVTLYFLFSGIGGTGGAAWLDLLARTVPAKRRSRVVAVRNAIGSGAGIIFPVLIAFILKNMDFPGNYRVLFFTAFVFLCISWIFFLFIKDVEVPPVNETSHRKFLGFLVTLLKNDPNFLHFLVSRILFSFCMITMSFYTVYFLSMNSSMDDSVIASFAMALNISKIIGGLLLGYLGDKKGNLAVYITGIVFIIPANLLVVFYPAVPLYYVVFILFGITVAADTNTYQSFIGEFGKRNDRIFYMTMASSIAGIFSGFLPVVAGAMLKSSVIDFRTLFVFCVCISIFTLLYVLRFVRDPRHIS